MTLRELFLFICAIILSISSTLIIQRLVSPPLNIVTFDLKGSVRQYAQFLAKQQLTEQKQQEKTAQFSQVLEHTLQRYSHDNQAVILVQSATINGARDINKEINHAVRTQLSTTSSLENVNGYFSTTLP